ncbi:hypothetical protein T492DRAFT_60974 [Pavlovales sp. CCMP2436]|nr:hypothetical protein T492DRAFT_60974 [Pavlovales sp. CCMP2436]
MMRPTRAAFAAATVLAVFAAFPASALDAPRATSLETCPLANPVESVKEIELRMDANGKVVDYAPVVDAFDLADYPAILDAMSTHLGTTLAMFNARFDEIMAATGAFGLEMTQLAGLLGVDLKKLLVLNIYYELAGGCTSIVVNSPSGLLLHGRNLDYSNFGAPGHGLDRYTFKARYVDDSSGALLFETATWLGYVGALTGVRKGSFSVTLNQRYNHGTVADNFAAAFPDGGSEVKIVAYSFALREQLFEGASYAQVVSNLVATPFAVGAYLTIGGIAPGEGTVIFSTRPDVGSMTHTFGTADGDGYPCASEYCLVTNYDKIADAPDPGEQFRITGGESNLERAFPTLTASSLMSEVLTQCPTQTVDSYPTVYSVVMEAKSGSFDVRKSDFTPGAAVNQIPVDPNAPCGMCMHHRCNQKNNTVVNQYCMCSSCRVQCGVKKNCKASPLNLRAALPAASVATAARPMAMLAAAAAAAAVVAMAAVRARAWRGEGAQAMAMMP